MKYAIGFLAPVAALISGCQTTDGTQSSSRIGQAALKLSNGQQAGTAQLFTSGSQVSFSISLTGLQPGVHGMHLHTTGSCDSADFSTAGGHLNPGNRQHGSENPAGSHLGDLPNVVIGQDGKGTVSATLPGTADQVIGQVYDSDGTAVVVHANADDYRTDPSGNAGGRIACGVIARG